MAFTRRDTDFQPLSRVQLAAWAELPTALVSDVLNRGQTMGAAVKPLKPGMRLCGQARTVMPMVGDNSMVHTGCSLARPGEVMVVASRGHLDTAMFGGVIGKFAALRGLGGLVTDGAVRDVAELRALDLPIFAAGATPAGPHKNFGGTLDGPAAVGGIPVSPGDLVLGDDDGVVVVPLGRLDESLEACCAQLGREAEWMQAIAEGRTLVEIFSLPPLDQMR